MRVPCSASRPAVLASKRSISSSSVRLKVRRTTKQKSTLRVLEIPGVPAEPTTPIATKLQERLQRTSSKFFSDKKHVEKNSSPDRIKEAVPGWGEDKLAPPPEASAPESKRKSRDPVMRTFESEAFYRHSSGPPHFDRRVHKWIPSFTGKKTLETIQPDVPQPPVPQLAHSLDRVLFNPGPHWLRDPRSQIYNFDPELEKIPDIHDFDFKRLLPYVTSSRDETLVNLAKREGKLFAGSTSSLSSMLSHIYFILSNGRETDTSNLSSAFAKESRDFTYGARWPGGIVFKHQDGVYCIDSDGVEEPEKHLLLNLGTMLEKFITHSPSEFDNLRRNSPVTDELKALQGPESYRYSRSDKFVMRSQLDAQDSRLPGTGVFDIKTRAAVAIRYDPLNYHNNAGYQIKTNQGPFESFEREQYDLIRAAFLKYLFQVRIGDMDGIFVAYHNTAKMFGFEYFSREFMDERLFGGSVQGDRVFDRCVKCMEDVASEIAMCFPGESVKCAFETAEGAGVLRIYVEPEEWDEQTQGERPIVQLLVTATNYLNGNRILDPMDFGTRADDWGTLLNITRSSSSLPGLSESIKSQRDALLKRKNTFSFWLPQGVSAEEMAERWIKIDYTGKTIDDSENGMMEQASAASAEELAQLTLKFKQRSRPSSFVTALRRMSRNGISEVKVDSAEVNQAKEDSGPSPGVGITTPALHGAPPLPRSVERDSPEEVESERSARDISVSEDEEKGSSFAPEAVGTKPEQSPGQVLVTDVHVGDISVHVKITEDDLPGHAAPGKIHNSTERSFSDNPAINIDNFVPPTEGEILEMDLKEPVDIVIGSEEDHLIETLDPNNDKNSHHQLDKAPGLDEEGGGEPDVVELGTDDQAWSTPSQTSGNRA